MKDFNTKNKREYENKAIEFMSKPLGEIWKKLWLKLVSDITIDTGMTIVRMNLDL